MSSKTVAFKMNDLLFSRFSKIIESREMTVSGGLRAAVILYCNEIEGRGGDNGPQPKRGRPKSRPFARVGAATVEAPMTNEERRDRDRAERRQREAYDDRREVKRYPPAPVFAPEWDAARELADQRSELPEGIITIPYPAGSLGGPSSNTKTATGTLTAAGLQAPRRPWHPRKR